MNKEQPQYAVPECPRCGSKLTRNAHQQLKEVFTGTEIREAKLEEWYCSTCNIRSD